MTYSTTKYNKLKTLRVPRVTALALSDDSNPLGVMSSSAVAAAVADIPTPGSTTAAICGAKINELLASLRTAGLLAP